MAATFLPLLRFQPLTKREENMGPLSGFKIIELAGIGPGPFCGMMLSDMGAEVIRVERLSGVNRAPKDVLVRNRRNIALDLKSEAGVETVLRPRPRHDRRPLPTDMHIPVTTPYHFPAFLHAGTG